MTFTLFSHFYNEELLLPFWIKHHQKLFDHAVLIDYGSTDNSVDIIRTLAPTWEIVRSRNEKFGAGPCDAEVMDHETRFGGWKIALNTTEFLLHWDLNEEVEKIGRMDPGIRTQGVIMIDPQRHRNMLLTESPLMLQRYHGYYESDNRSRSRLFHNQKHGWYKVGRHLSNYHCGIDVNFLCLWFGWSPMDFIKTRKMQIQHRIPKEQFALGHGIEHILDDGKFEWAYAQQVGKTTDLTQIVHYRDILTTVRDRLYADEALPWEMVGLIK